jgi:two-component system, NtrC family, sensor histidine kinase HydH
VCEPSVFNWEKNDAEPEIRYMPAVIQSLGAVSAELRSVHIVEVVPEGLVITLDRHRMRRVLVKLFVNTLEVMPSGGTIRISAVSDCRYVLIEVRDTGPGFPPAIRDRLFRPCRPRVGKSPRLRTVLSQILG